MVIILFFTGFVFAILVFGRLHLYVTFSKEVKHLFFLSKNISKERFRYSQLLNLPEPVQRYFKNVLKEGQSYISYARITHNGLFKAGIDKDWIKIQGEQYATTATPGFIWKGTTLMFTARDMHIANKGRLIVLLFSLYKVVDAKG